MRLTLLDIAGGGRKEALRRMYLKWQIVKILNFKLNLYKGDEVGIKYQQFQ